MTRDVIVLWMPHGFDGVGSVCVCVQVMTSANYAPHALMTYLTLGPNLPSPILCSFLSLKEAS